MPAKKPSVKRPAFYANLRKRGLHKAGAARIANSKKKK